MPSCVRAGIRKCAKARTLSVVAGFAIRIFVLSDMKNEAIMASADCIGKHALRVGQRGQRSFFAWLSAKSLCGFAQLVGPQKQQMAVTLFRASTEMLPDEIQHDVGERAVTPSWVLLVPPFLRLPRAPRSCSRSS